MRKKTNLFSRFFNILLVMAITLSGVAHAGVTVYAESRSVKITGLVNETTEGYINSKAVIVGETNAKASFNLTPAWAQGTAFGTRVVLQLPSLNFIDGEYVKADNHGDVGITGTVASGGGYKVIGDTTSNGGQLVLEYEGGLSAGNNPAFEINLSTYTKDENLSIPEGTKLDLYGFVTYANFNQEGDTAWMTPGSKDNESEVSLIVSNLQWDAKLESVLEDGETNDTVPIWDRYQYVTYDYTIENISDNAESMIEGFNTTFDIDSTSSEINGIIPFDINRYSYIDGKPVQNDDPDNIRGQFIGVPGQGGVLIYDITDTQDNENPIAGLEPLPYIYSGSGMIEINQSKQAISPDNERVYRISLPLSRQGFPNVPTKFKVRTITNILFAQGVNWTKTHISEREILDPVFDMEYKHTYQQENVVYGYETYFELSDLINHSNVPVFAPEIEYVVAEGYNPSKLHLSIPKDSDYTFSDIFNSEFLTYTITDDKGELETVVKTLPKSFTTDEDGNQIFEISVADVESAFTLHYKDSFKKYESQTYSIKLYGNPTTIGPMTHSAKLVYIEKQASNDELGENTTYTDVPHEVVIDRTINVIYPKEVKPSISMKINGGGSFDKYNVWTGNGTFDEEITLDYTFGTNNEMAEYGVFSATFNEPLAIHDAQLILKEGFLDLVETIVAVQEDGSEIPLDITLTSDLPAGTVGLKITTSQIQTDGPQHFVSIVGRLDKGILKTHDVDAHFETYQKAPYDKTSKASALGRVNIILPNELNVAHTVESFYGNLKSNNVAYESNFDVSLQLDTKGVISPQSTYTIDLQKPSKDGYFQIQNIVMDDEFITGYTAYTLDGKVHEDTLPYNQTITKIMIRYENLKLTGAREIVRMTIKADIDMGSSQDIKATFKGSQARPFLVEKVNEIAHKVTVFDTKTAIEVKGVNQVDEKLGVGNKYSVDIYRHWNRGYTYNTQDWTLDQGYKSLGGFTNSITRPTQTYANNDQTLKIATDLPNHFDLYYLKIREEMKPYITSVDIYRNIDGEDVVWQSVSGDQWVNNTLENKYWRINTALMSNEGDDLFATYDTTQDLYEHPYFKSAWHEDVRPEQPITKVEITLNFERLSENDAPQMAGAHKDVIEYMGRFHSTSTKKEATPVQTDDAFGMNRDQARQAKHTINSLVGYPFARTSTGAHDTTSLPRKAILMGTTGEFKTSIQNLETFSVPYWGGHGPDIYTPVRTEHDEWLQMRNSGFFHDTLIYEFTYPTRPSQDDIYHYTPSYFVVENTRDRQYLDSLIIYGEDKSIVEIDNISIEGSIRVNYVEGDTVGYNISDGQINVTLKAGETPTHFEAYFKEIQGFGERTSELDGTSQDQLGALSDVDIRIGGIVNGDKDLTGTTKLYRLPDDSKVKTLLGTTSAKLAGITPKLNGKLGMTFDNLKVYDFGADGLTPNTTQVDFTLLNQGEADITDVDLTFTPDSNFRTQTLSIPKEIFESDFWVDKVTIDNVDVTEFFELEGGHYTLNLNALYQDKILKSTSYKQNGITYNKLDARNIKVHYKPNQDRDVRIFGQFTKDERDDQTLPSVMIDGSILSVTGIWVDQSDSGEWNWDAAPSFTSDNTKASRETITAYTNFSVEADLTPYQSIFVSSGGGNRGQHPKLTLDSRYSSQDAPRLYNRVARLNLTGTHLDNNLDVTKSNNLFYDGDTDAHVSYTNLTVGDTNYLVYKISNTGVLAKDDLSPGDLPIFNPSFELIAPKGLKITEVTPLESITDYVDVQGFVKAEIDTHSLSDKRYSANFTNTLDFGESMYVLAKFETENDFSDKLGDTQNKTMVWQAYAKPAKTHSFFSYNGYGQDDFRTHGRTDQTLESQYYANVYNTAYRFANPNKLRIKSQFVSENVSGKETLLTVENIENETLHDNTHLQLTITLDKNKDRLKAVQNNTYGGFELSAFPTPETMEGYDTPIVSFEYQGKPVLVSDYDDGIHDMKDINTLFIDYGIVEANFQAPKFTIDGIGHWKTLNSLTNKNYDIYSVAHIDMIHDTNSLYQFTTEANSRVWKAIAQTELNLQAFDTKDEAQGEYNGPLVGKHSYKPGDVYYQKLSLLNIDNAQGLSTNTPYGKADLLNPVIYDKVPEYISIDDVEIKIFDKHGDERSFQVPTITEKVISGLDVGGSQVFKNDRHNDGYGRISTQEPSNTKHNKAKNINFNLITYTFDQDDLKRGERLEITYKANIRHNDLPYATYENGNGVFAPFMGWYGDNTPVSNTFKDVTMDMASLLHDVGVSGNKGHEITSDEFLSNSSSWTHGGTEKRKNATNTWTLQDTYYDASANKEKSHKAWMNEEKTNDLHVSFGGGLEEVYNYLTKARVNDGKVSSDERIMWAQNGMQLSRAWLYGASEMVPDVKRQSHGVDASDFYEHDGSLNHANNHRWGYTPYNYDDYTYAVDLHEHFTVKLHAANLGDRAIESGLTYTEILPVGISPYAQDGTLLGISVSNDTPFTYKVLQTPEDDNGYRAPLQNQEAGTYDDQTREGIPYVLEISTTSEISPWFKGSDTGKYQEVAIRVRVDHRVEPNADLGVHKDMSVFYDELRITPNETEEYLEIYSHEYGAFTRGVDTSTWAQNAKYYRNDAVAEGLELNHAWLSSHNYTTYLSFEPYGQYIRGINAQNTRIDKDTLVTGDQIAAKKPTPRVWVNPEKLDKVDSRYGNIDNFDLNIYDELKLHTTIENQQLEVRPEYNRQREGYNRYSGDNYNADIWVNAPQTIGGARGGIFEPHINILLPNGFAPIDGNGEVIRPYHDVIEQSLDFEAGIYKVTGLHTKELVNDVTEFLDTTVTLVDGQFNLEFSVNTPKSVDVPYDHILVVTPKVKVIAEFEGEVVVSLDSDRDIFTPIISERYTTGDVPSTIARDIDYRILGRNGVKISENDRKRLDSTSTYPTNMGELKISERLIRKTTLDNRDVIGATEFKLRQASIWNTTKTLNYADSNENDVSQVDPAGRHWYLTEVRNDVIANSDKYIESHSAGDVHHSRFLLTYLVSDFAKVTENVKIKLGDDIFNPEDIGFTVDYVATTPYKDGRNKVQFIVTPPNGTLLSSDSFKFLFEVLMVDGFKSDVQDGDPVWKDDSLIVDSYISLITDDKTVGTLNEKDFVVQTESNMNYRIHTTDDLLGENMNGSKVEDYAHNKAEVEIVKPKLEIRKNTYRPRELYSNGLTGDNYFNAADVIEYIINHVEVTGSSVKEVIVEDILPTSQQTESSIDISRLPITTDIFTVSTGIWDLPQETMDRIAKAGLNVDDLYKVYVYTSDDAAIDGYELDGWNLLNPEGTSITTNQEIAVGLETKKVRIILRALDHENYLIPTGTRLAVDADAEMDGKQSVIETDPDNLNIELMPKGIVDNAIRITMSAKSDATATLFIYNNAQAWANYVGEAVAKLDQSQTRSYLTPSRPVVNVRYNALNFRSVGDQKYGWSNNTNINPHQLPHMLFQAEFINADDTMWDEEESNAYKADLLRDPFISFELPKVMKSLQGKLQFVERVDETSPLHEDYTNPYGLTEKNEGLWTWSIKKADGTRSELELKDVYTGPHAGSENNIMSLWFDGDIAPGDSVVVEFIGSINYFAVPVKGDLQSKAKISNNTGLLTPLNSRWNFDNKLGYTVDALDLNKNGSTSDRQVFAERDLFTYENVDNFKKTKRSYSDLNLAGTQYPEITPVKQGGLVTFETAIDNSQEAENRTYPYPIFYDVLPHVGDTTMYNKGIPRNSKFDGLLLPETIKLEIEGSETKEFAPREYTVFVGPFKKTGSKIERVELPEGAETEKFYNDLKTPGQASSFRNEYFVTLADFNKYAQGREVEIQSVLAMFNSASYQMPARSKIKLSYDMKAGINAPTHLDETQAKEDYTMWNTFSATQRVEGFSPQESNLAGAYPTEQSEYTYFGGYIWHDYNINGLLDDGKLITDINGRELLQPDPTDYGINGVDITLKTPRGNYVDNQGRPIHYENDAWYVMDEDTGKTVIDEVFQIPVLSDGPLITKTENDYHGNAGYYVFSNIPKGSYVAEYVFDPIYKGYGITTQDTIEIKEETLKSKTRVIDLTQAMSDQERMSINIGIANQIKLGGTIFVDTNVNGTNDRIEVGYENAIVTLEDVKGNVVKDQHGQDITTTTNDKGEYEFLITPKLSQYVIDVQTQDDNVIVSPVIHNIDPLKVANDNDGYTYKDDTKIQTNIINLDLDELYTSKFKDKMSISVGVYEFVNEYTWGNRVWNDINQNGLQDENEPGLKGQVLHIEQYLDIDGQWVKQAFKRQTTSNTDGFYYFGQLPDRVDGYTAGYKVYVDSLIDGYNITLTHVGDDENIDNNFRLDGTIDDILVLTEDNTSVDLGLHIHQTGRISGDIFLDENYNHIHDAGEHPADEYLIILEQQLANGTWKFVDSSIGNTYVFEDLDMVKGTQAISYRVVVKEIPLWFEAVDYQIGENKSQDSDFLDAVYDQFLTVNTIGYQLNDMAPNGSLIELDTFTPGDVKDIDLGLRQLDKQRIIGDFLWYDTNKNGLQDAGERGVVDMPIHLYRVVNNTLVLVDSSHTDHDGYYEFTADLADFDTNKPYEYVVVFDRLSRHELTHITGDDKINSDFSYNNGKYTNIPDAKHSVVSRVANIATTRGGYVNYQDSQDDRAIDGGLILHDTILTIGDTIYHDMNNNGLQDPGERGIAGINITLMQDGVIHKSTTTDNDGKYHFEVEALDLDKTSDRYLDIYEYDVIVHTPANYVVTSDNFEALDATTAQSKEITLIDSDGDLNSQTDDLTQDAGYMIYKTEVELSGIIWNDQDRDGFIEDELREKGRTVTLWKLENGEWVEFDTTTTDRDGRYVFTLSPTNYDPASDDFLVPYEYKVSSQKRTHENWTVLENDNHFNSDGVSHPFDVFTQGDVASVKDDVRNGGLNIYDTTVRIGGTVWSDDNFDGIMDSDEDRISDQNIVLWKLADGQWSQEDTTTSQADGTYEFVVSPSDYSSFDLPVYDYKVTTERTGNQLFSPHTQGDDKTVDSNIHPKQPTHVGYSDHFDIVDTVDEKIDISSLRDDLDMGIGIKTYQKDVAIGGIVWEDFNQDAIKDPSEFTHANKDITLHQKIDGQWIEIGQTQTDVKGYYEFIVDPTSFDIDSEDYLRAYEYRVTFNREGYQIYSAFETEDMRLVDDIGHTGYSQTFEIFESGNPQSATDDITMHIGIKTHENTVKVGGVVFEDEDRNGIASDDELRHEDHEVELFQFDPRLDDWIYVTNTHTDAQGYYEFIVAPTSYDLDDELYMLPYQYQARYVRQGNHVFTQAHQGDDITLDSDVYQEDAFVGHLVPFDIFDEGQMDSLRDDIHKGVGILSIDPKVTIGDIVWSDDNFDGIMDDFEMGLESIRVLLEQYDAKADTWNVVDETTTNQGGHYEFTVDVTNTDKTHEAYLVPYQYRTVIVIPSGYEVTTNAYDSNHVEATKTHAYTRQAILSDVIDGSVDLLNLFDDHTLDVGLKRIPEIPVIPVVPEGEDLPPTGVGSIAPIYMTSIAIGVILLILGKRKEEES